MEFNRILAELMPTEAATYLVNDAEFKTLQYLLPPKNDLVYHAKTNLIHYTTEQQMADLIASAYLMACVSEQQWCFVEVGFLLETIKEYYLDMKVSEDGILEGFRKLQGHVYYYFYKNVLYMKPKHGWIVTLMTPEKTIIPELLAAK